MELGIKQLVSVAIVVLVGIFLMSISSNITENIEGSILDSITDITSATGTYDPGN